MQKITFCANHPLISSHSRGCLVATHDVISGFCVHSLHGKCRFLPWGNVVGTAAPYITSCYFSGIDTIQYHPDAAVDDVLCFKHYNPQQEVMGRSMEEWLRFSVCFWHTFRGTGQLWSRGGFLCAEHTNVLWPHPFLSNHALLV